MKINEKSLYKEIGKRIRDRRMQAGMTQSQLGEAIGLLRTSVVNIESGRQKTPVHVLYAISVKMGVEPHDLLPAVSELDQPMTVRIQIGGQTKEVPAKAAEFLSKLLEQTSGDKI